MAKTNMNPTRVSLFKLKKNLGTAVKGHRLLKDKRDELIRRSVAISAEIKDLREKVDERIEKSQKLLGVAAALMGDAEISESLILPQGDLECEVSFKNIMNIAVPEFRNVKESPMPDFGYSSAELYESVKELVAIKKDLFRLAGLEKSAEIMDAEIERTGRRVNALEHILIPEYSEAIRYIKMRLEENERANSIRLLKVKDMVIERKGM